MKLNEAILSEKNRQLRKEAKKKKSAVDKELKEIEKKLKGMDASPRRKIQKIGVLLVR